MTVMQFIECRILEYVMISNVHYRELCTSRGKLHSFQDFPLSIVVYQQVLGSSTLKPEPNPKSDHIFKPKFAENPNFLKSLFITQNP